jgi:hypothetical protein
MALKSITVTKGPVASGRAFGFRIGPKRPGNPSAGKIEVGDEPVKIDLQTPQALRVGLENQVQELVGRKYLTKVSAEDMPEQAQRASK